MKKNQNLTKDQENILFNEATEPPGSSELNLEKEKGLIIVQIVMPNFLSRQQSTKVDRGGLLFMTLYQMYLKLRQIII